MVVEMVGMGTMMMTIEGLEAMGCCDLLALRGGVLSEIFICQNGSSPLVSLEELHTMSMID
jgi:hypothetical protein